MRRTLGRVFEATQHVAETGTDRSDSVERAGAPRACQATPPIFERSFTFLE